MLYTKLCSTILFPLHERLKRHSSGALRRVLERTQWLQPQQLAALQLARLREFLIQANKNVPYYRDLFTAARFQPSDLATLEDLRNLPTLDKSLIRANLERLKSAVAGRLIRYNTGGSSGEPLVFYMGMERVSHDVAAKWRATRWWGVDIGDVEVVLWGSPVELGKQDRIKAWRDRLFRSHLLPAFEMSDVQLDRYVVDLERRRPSMLFGYASALALLAEHAERRAVDLDQIGIKVVFTTGETLYPQQRAVIERVFGAPVANGYGSRDAGFIAHQCPSGSLHVSAEHIVLEVLDANGRAVQAGESGEIVVTHLATGDFPFIRYRTGDVGVLAWQPCSCGRGLQVLEQVQGRSTDFIRTPSGNKMHALALIYEVRDKPGVRAFKFVQATDCSLELLLVPGPELTADVEAVIYRGVTKRIGDGAKLHITRVTQIAPEKSGKYRYVISHAS